MVSNRPSSSNSSFKVSSSSSSISSQCSSPTSLLQAPTLSQSGSKLSVPFLWEVKPGITKQPASRDAQGHHLSNSSSPAEAASSSYSSRNLFYNIGKSLDYPPYPLPPPPRLSQAFLSQPRSRDRKLLPTHSLLLRRRPHADATSWKKSSKESPEEQDDPFFLAMKACTKAVTKISSSGDLKPEKVGFDGLQAALRGFFKHTNKGRRFSMGSSKEFIPGEPLRISEGEPMIHANSAHPVARQCPTGGRCRRKYEESDDHRSIKEKISVSEEGKGRGKGVGTSRAMHDGSLHALFSQVDESESKGELRSGSNLRAHIFERHKEIPNQRSEQLIMPRKEAHVCHRNASGKPSSIGLLGHVHVGVAEKARMQGDPSAAKSSRNDHPINLDQGRQGIEPANNRRHGFSSKHNAKSKELISINQGHGKPSMQHNPKGFEELNSLNQGHDKPNKLINAKVDEFHSCGAGYDMMNEYSDHQHEQQLQSLSIRKNNIFSDLLGCRSALPCSVIDGASIHPSLIKPFSFHQ